MGDQEMEEEEDKAALKSVLEKGLALVAVESADTSQYSTTMGDSYCAYIDPEKGVQFVHLIINNLEKKE
jgi:hypothetical protein